jgi:PAS domain-containing protein
MLAGIGSDIGQLIERKRKKKRCAKVKIAFALWRTARPLPSMKAVYCFYKPAVEKVFGYPPEQMIGHDLTMLMPECLRHLHRAGFQRYQETGKKHSLGSGRTARLASERPRDSVEIVVW